MQIRVLTRDFIHKYKLKTGQTQTKPPLILKCIIRQVQQNGESAIEHTETQIQK